MNASARRVAGTILVANKIALGQIECGIAGGVDTTSDAPLAANEDLRALLLELSRANSNGARLKLLTRLRPQQIVPKMPRNAEPRTGLSMGEHAAIWLEDQVVPFLGLERDQNLRPDSSFEKLSKLKPVSGGSEGTMTAGNSTPLSDGASTALLATEEWAAAHDIPVQAYITAAQTAAVDHVHKREGLLMAPAYAMPKMLARAGLTGAGHPFRATGARIVATLAKALGERGSGRGVISICAAGGLGVTAIMEGRAGTDS